MLNEIKFNLRFLAGINNGTSRDTVFGGYEARVRRRPRTHAAARTTPASTSGALHALCASYARSGTFARTGRKLVHTNSQINFNFVYLEKNIKMVKPLSLKE